MVLSAHSSMAPPVKILGNVTVRALDSLPLPLLVIVFVACLALIQIRVSPTPSILPTHTPPSLSRRSSPSPSEKPAGSPLFHLGAIPASTSQTVHSPRSLAGFGSLTQALTQAQAGSACEYTIGVTVQSGMGPSSAGGGGGSAGGKVVLPMGRNVRRGSKGLKNYRLGLGVVEEVDGEMDLKEVV